MITKDTPKAPSPAECDRALALLSRLMLSTGEIGPALDGDVALVVAFERRGAVEALTRLRDLLCDYCKGKVPLVTGAPDFHDFNQPRSRSKKARFWPVKCQAVEVRRLIEEYQQTGGKP